MKKTLSIAATSLALQAMPVQAETPLVNCIQQAGERNEWGYEIVVGEAEKLSFRIFTGIPDAQSDVIASNDNTGMNYIDLGGDGKSDITAGIDYYQEGPSTAADNDVYTGGVLQVYEKCVGKKAVS